MTDLSWVYVDTPAGLEKAAAACRRAVAIGVDTESNSLHAYREKVCFVQIAVRDRVFLIDTVALRDLEPLRPVFADPETTTIIHGADYDVVCLKRDFGLSIGGLFDTMVVAQILGLEQVGLAALLESRLGIPVDKSMTRHDWGARPLDPRCLPYLIEDVRHLERLARGLHQDLERLDRVEEAEIEFARVAAQAWNGNSHFDPEGYLQIKGARTLDHPGLAVLRELHALREHLAEKADVPPFKVLGNIQLLEVAARRPRTPDALRRIPGFSPRVLSRHGEAVLRAVAAGLRRQDVVPLRVPSRAPRPPQEEVDAEEALRRWRKARVAAEAVPPLVILPNHVMSRLAQTRPRTLAELERIEGLGPKRRRLYGEQLLEVLAGASGHPRRR